MKVVSFDNDRVGILAGDKVYDVTGSVGALADGGPPLNMIRFLSKYGNNFKAIEILRTDSPSLSSSDVRLNAPIVWPNKLIAYPANFRDHIREMSSAYRADTRGFFLKANSSISGPGDSIMLPRLEGRAIHHECEFATIIGAGGRNIPAERALAHVFGYACLVDLTVRGEEERVMRKSFDTFTPIGPYIVTSDEVGDIRDQEIALSVNGERRQHARVADLILDVPGMIHMASSVMTLHPGDIIASGTPAGVGPLEPGDTVVISGTSLGSMSLKVLQRPASPSDKFWARN